MVIQGVSDVWDSSNVSCYGGNENVLGDGIRNDIRGYIIQFDIRDIRRNCYGNG